MRAFIAQHKIFLVILILVLELITILPTVYGFLATPSGYYYNGIHNFRPVDFHLYLSYFEQIKQGSWLLEDLYTSEKQSANLFNLFFILFGSIGKIFNISNIATYHFARSSMIPFLIVALTLFLSLFFKERKKLYVAIIITTFGSGIGAWLVPFFGQNFHINSSTGYIHQPMDLWVPEFSTFLTIYHNPLYTTSLALILLIFFLFIKSIDDNKMYFSVIAGLLGFLLFNIHPYHIPTIYLISAAWILTMVVMKRLTLFSAFKYWGLFFLFSSPMAAYQILLLLIDPIMHQRYHNTSEPPTVLWLTVASYGFLLLFALPEIWRLIRTIIRRAPFSRVEHRLLFPFFWFITGILLIYMPFFKHALRLTEGLAITLAIFTTIFLFRQTTNLWYRKLQRLADMRIIVPISFLFLFGMSTIYVIASDVNLYATKHSKVYIPIQVYDGIQWIKKYTTSNDVILTDLFNGNLIPGIAGRHVYIGHTSETALYNLKERWLLMFFAQNRDEASELRFLSENRISHIFFTDSLKEMGTWRPENKYYLSKVFKNENAVIYKVQ